MLRKSVLRTMFAVMAMFVLGAAVQAWAATYYIFESVTPVERTTSMPYYSTVLEAKNMPMDSTVAIRGYIVERLQSGRYIVKDATSYVFADIPESAYADSLERARVVRASLPNDRNARDRGEKMLVETIVNPNARVEIVGRMGSDGDGPIVRADSVVRIR